MVIWETFCGLVQMLDLTPAKELGMIFDFPGKEAYGF